MSTNVQGPTTTTPTKYEIVRSDDLPLRFTGTEIGNSTENHRDNDVHREVTLFRTAGGTLVGWTFYDANYMVRPESNAESFATAKDLIGWLRDPETKKIYSPALNALKEAAKNDSEVAEAFAEVVP